MTRVNTRQRVFQTHRKTVLSHLGWVYLPSIDLAVKTALHRVNGEGIPNDITLEAFGSMAMFATNMKATIEDCTEGFGPDNYREVTAARRRHRE